MRVCTAASPAPVGDPLLGAVESLVRDVVLPEVAAWDRDDVLPDALWDRLVALGLPGALVPEEHGGGGRTVGELVPVWRALSRGWISLTGAINPTGLATTLLLAHGTDAQRRRWLPVLGSGDGHAAFSITEPGAGSDLSNIVTTAEPVDGGLRLDGRKRWVAGGVSSAVVLMMVRTGEGLSCAVVPAEGRDSPTWRVEEIDKIGYRGVESAAYVFEGHEAVGAEILGGPDAAGQGARQMLGALGVGRVNVACRALGIVDRALAVALDEATHREVGGAMLGEHTHAQLRIGELRARLLAAESLTLRAAEAVDAGSDEARDLASAAKIVASDLAVLAVDRAARLAASRSYRADDELARLRRDAPQTQIGEGANDALLLAMGRAAVDEASTDA
ncbi:acyl-CoA dehydrogenase family protein [Patulibacter sp.]|uniref:acyl-CoA dehydrogenase family protein n=1 Tax=Patulibacter sp. TaxID=1912859 RepID=UPI002721E7E4|nr:acyl-CoA dehydrogenase family protein [Patulibacter sp.]MDO9410235.1 acyl-CoA dehydrogenase family protein [Patulibacter sp.]